MKPRTGVLLRRGYICNSNGSDILQTAKGISKCRGLRSFALLAVLLLGLLWVFRSLLPGSAGDYQLTEIPSQGTTLFLRALNDNGRAAGCTGSPGQGRAVVWDVDGGIKNLATPDGYCSLAMDINNSGEVCGELRDPNDRARACFWDRQGRASDIGTPGGRVSIAERLNDKGKVVGWAQTSGGVTHAFLWTKEQGIIDLDSRSSMHSYAKAVNNHGQVVGSLTTKNNERHAFIWHEHTGMVDIHDRLKGTQSVACDINNRGEIIGQYMITDGQSRAFVWDKSRGFRDLRIISDMEWGCSPAAITDRGQCVAAMREKRAKIFGFVIREDSGLSRLFDHKLRRKYLLEGLPFDTDYCILRDINNDGQIIASARKSRSYRWYLMTPAVQGN